MSPSPANVLLDVCDSLVACAYDLGVQIQGAPDDREEVLRKLDGVAELVASARSKYLAAEDSVAVSAVPTKKGA